MPESWWEKRMDGLGFISDWRPSETIGRKCAHSKPTTFRSNMSEELSLFVNALSESGALPTLPSAFRRVEYRRPGRN